MYCVGRIRSPCPWVLGRPIPCIGSASSDAIEPAMANPLDELCRFYQDPSFHLALPISTPTAMSGKLLLQCLQNNLEKEQLKKRLANLASQIGVAVSGDCRELLDSIGSRVKKSERRAKTLEEKYLDQAMKIQVLELELAQSRRQRDTAVQKLQDLTGHSIVLSPPAVDVPTTHVSWCPQTPSTAPLDNRVAPISSSTRDTAPINSSTPDTAPYNPSTPNTATYNPSTPDTLPNDTIPLSLVPPSPSPQVSGPGTHPNGTPPAVPLSAQAYIVPNQVPHTASRSPSVGGAIGGATSPSVSAAVAPTPSGSSFVWGFGDLKSFHQDGGDVVLGSGAHGVVSLHRHRVTDRAIALKTFTLPNDDREMRKKMEAIEVEASILEVLGREECFPTFLGCLKISPGKIGIAMEFIGDEATGETWTLSRAMRELALSEHDWFSLALDMAKSLGRIHEKGFLMTDLKEENCLLRKTSAGQWQAVIVDFGLACSRSSPYGYYFTNRMKAKYRRKENFLHIAPECALDDMVTSVSSDVFQLGRLFTLMGNAAIIDDLTAIGNTCRQDSYLCRPSIDEVVDELKRVMEPGTAV